MVSLPDFDPNQFVTGISDFEYKQLDRDQAFNNFAIQGLYPPVSDVKVISDYVSHKKGGEGCVRDIIEQVLRVQGKWKTK